MISKSYSRLWEYFSSLWVNEVIQNEKQITNSGVLLSVIVTFDTLSELLNERPEDSQIWDLSEQLYNKIPSEYIVDLKDEEVELTNSIIQRSLTQEQNQQIIQKVQNELPLYQSEFVRYLDYYKNSKSTAEATNKFFHSERTVKNMAFKFFQKKNENETQENFDGTSIFGDQFQEVSEEIESNKRKIPSFGDRKPIPQIEEEQTEEIINYEQDSNDLFSEELKHIEEASYDVDTPQFSPLPTYDTIEFPVPLTDKNLEEAKEFSYNPYETEVTESVVENINNEKIQDYKEITNELTEFKQINQHSGFNLQSYEIIGDYIAKLHLRDKVYNNETTQGNILAAAKYVNTQLKRLTNNRISLSFQEEQDLITRLHDYAVNNNVVIKDSKLQTKGALHDTRVFVRTLMELPENIRIDFVINNKEALQ